LAKSQIPIPVNGMTPTYL